MGLSFLIGGGFPPSIACIFIAPNFACMLVIFLFGAGAAEGNGMGMPPGDDDCSEAIRSAIPPRTFGFGEVVLASSPFIAFDEEFITSILSWIADFACTCTGGNFFTSFCSALEAFIASILS